MLTDGSPHAARDGSESESDELDNPLDIPLGRLCVLTGVLSVNGV